MALPIHSFLRECQQLTSQAMMGSGRQVGGQEGGRASRQTARHSQSEEGASVLPEEDCFPHLPSAVTLCTLKDLESTTGSNYQSKAPGIMSSKSLVAHNPGAFRFPQVPPQPSLTVCLQAQIVPVTALHCPMPRTASSWQPNPRMSLDAATSFDLSSKCLVAAVD